MENQPKPTNKKKHNLNPTLQDKLYATWKIFWKAGYSYKATGDNEHFYTEVLNDVLQLDMDEFLEKYGN